MRTPLIILLSSLICFNVQGSENLPSLAGSTNSSYQLEQERALGQAWMRMMKAQAQLLDDPIVESYLKDRLWYLSPFSELQDKRLDLLVIDQQEVNAFAAPGGIIGINAGLLLATETEDQLMSVIAHEFAHLSQRHFAQQQAASE
ncbi:MAG: M48 family metallopeptidase, partial [Marinobacterium sp.]